MQVETTKQQNQLLAKMENNRSAKRVFKTREIWRETRVRPRTDEIRQTSDSRRVWWHKLKDVLRTEQQALVINDYTERYEGSWLSKKKFYYNEHAYKKL